MPGLNLNRLVNVQINLSPLAPARRGFGTLLIVGDSSVISATERIRSYTDIEAVATDFGITAPEYSAAALYFSQQPRPNNLMIGRWVRVASGAELVGGILTPEEQAIANWTAITDGSFQISVDGVSQEVTGLNFSTITNLNQVATLITTELTNATVLWTGERFRVETTTTGATSSLSYATAASTGTAIASQLKLTSETALAPIPGQSAETALDAVVTMSDMSGNWYGLTFASSIQPVDDEYIAVSGFIEASSISRIFGVTATDTRTLDPTFTDDIASRMADLNYRRTTVAYSRNEYAIASMLGRAFSVDFNANNSTITLMYKQEPGVSAETITETQAQALQAKRCNVFVNYNNDTAIIQYGVMSGPYYFDEVHGLDWFADALQNALYTLLYTSATKIPQTDAGQNQLITETSRVCQEAVNNGLVAPGTWNADGFGQLTRGDYLPSGFYVYSTPIAYQPQSVREQRIAPPIQVAIKLAGAIHQINATVFVNR